MRYLFQLGHQPQISTAEITAVFALKHINIKTERQNNTFLILDVDKNIDCDELINTLGGTIKIARRIDVDIPDYLEKTQPAGKIVFSLPDKKLAIRIKKELRQAGRSVRYVEPKNAATILHNNLVELGGDLTIANNEIFATEAIQPFEEFSERDYGRPVSDNKSGMLPPKLARVLINLAQIPKDATILDPFCGSGTILTEAVSMGYENLIASDISQKAIVNTEKNLKWAKDNFQFPRLPCPGQCPGGQAISNFQTFRSSASDLSKHLKPSSINAIITEPLLGKLLTGKESKNQLQSQAKELSQLYIDSFKTFAKILKPNGAVLFIIPKFKFGNSWIEIDCVDKIKKTGFKTVPFEILDGQSVEHLTYHRPNQHLARTIWRFQMASIGN